MSDWDKIFPKSDKVDVTKVKFKNRYGITLVGDLYIPKTLKEGDKTAGIATCGPFGAVKEQASGLYAQRLAESGFITLAFDPSFTGESSGEVRNVASPDINTEDYSAAVDFLCNYKNVDPERIGILGICGFGGFALNAAVNDTRIKATVAVTMYDMSRFISRGLFDSLDAEGRKQMRKKLNDQRTEDFKNGTYAKEPTFPEKFNGDEPLILKNYYKFYKTKIGYHERSIYSNGNWNATSPLGFLNNPILQYSDEIDSAVLIVSGEKSHSRYFSEDEFKKLKGTNKELFIVPEAEHIDFYFDNEKIPFTKIESFLKTYLN